jgi:hypothetical protein
MPLSERRACSSQKKYGAYYNAAAHLRRSHFKPRYKVRSKTELEAENLGADGWVNWPSMSELKFWMKEVEDVDGVDMAVEEVKDIEETREISLVEEMEEMS